MDKFDRITLFEKVREPVKQKLQQKMPQGCGWIVAGSL